MQQILRLIEHKELHVDYLIEQHIDSSSVDFGKHRINRLRGGP